MSVQINLKITAHANAQVYFNMIKDLQRKKAVATTASIHTISTIEQRGQKELNAVKEIQAKQRRKIWWFEKFYWMITSENFIVVGGRDSTQNEVIVKRYLDTNDIYFHADIHGASSVIIKVPTSYVQWWQQTHENVPLQLPQRTLEEAASFTVSHSNAWVNKSTNTRAYWVYAHQVSKTPPTGMFLEKGSFMVRGIKNFLDSQPLVMGVGLLFKCGDDATIARHIGERAIRSMAGHTGDDDSSQTISDKLAKFQEEENKKQHEIEQLIAKLEKEQLDRDLRAEAKARAKQIALGGATTEDGTVGDPADASAPVAAASTAEDGPVVTGVDGFVGKRILSKNDRYTMKKLQMTDPNVYWQWKDAQKQSGAGDDSLLEQSELLENASELSIDDAGADTVDAGGSDVDAAGDIDVDVSEAEEGGEDADEDADEDDEDDISLAQQILLAHGDDESAVDGSDDEEPSSGDDVDAFQLPAGKRGLKTMLHAKTTAPSQLSKADQQRFAAAEAATPEDDTTGVSQHGPNRRKGKTKAVREAAKQTKLAAQNSRKAVAATKVNNSKKQLQQEKQQKNQGGGKGGQKQQQNGKGAAASTTGAQHSTESGAVEGQNAAGKAQSPNQSVEIDEEEPQDELQMQMVMLKLQQQRLEMEGTALVLSTLTAHPGLYDNLTHAIPIVAPYTALSDYDYKIKLLPGGNTKKGQTIKDSLHVFNQNTADMFPNHPTARTAGKGQKSKAAAADPVPLTEEELVQIQTEKQFQAQLQLLVKQISENEFSLTMLSNAKVSVQGITQVHRAQKIQKKLDAKERDAAE